MRGKDCKRNEMAYGRHYGHASLAKLDVDACIGKGGDGIANKGGEKD